MARKEEIFPIETMGGRLQRLRKSKGYDRVAFHTLVCPNVPLEKDSRQKTVHNWESGKTSPDYDTLKKMCRVLDCDTDYLLCMQDMPRHATVDISAQTRLSESAINTICKWKNNFPAIVDILSNLIISPYFYDLLNQIHTAIEYSTPLTSDELQQEYDAVKKIVGIDSLPYPDLIDVSKIDNALKWLSEYSTEYVLRDRKSSSVEAIHEAQNMFLRAVDEIMKAPNIENILKVHVQETYSENELQTIAEKLKNAGIV